MMTTVLLLGERGEGGERLMLRWSLRAAAGQPAGDSQQ